MRKARRARANLLILYDGALFALAFLLAAYLAIAHMGLVPRFGALSLRQWAVLAGQLVAWIVAARALGFYDDFRARSFSDTVANLAKLTILTGAVGVGLIFFLQEDLLYRYFILVEADFVFVLVGLNRGFLRLYFGARHRRGQNLREVVIVGTGRVAGDLIASFASLPHLGNRVVGLLGDPPLRFLGAPYLGPVEELPRILDVEPVDDVIITDPDRWGEGIHEIVESCRRYPVTARIVPDFVEVVGTRFRVSTLANFPIVTLHASPLDTLPARLAKRAFDLLVSAGLFVLVFSWLWPVLALTVKLSSRGPVFFKQERWGMRNRRIVCWKFRTMRAGAPEVDESGRFRQALRGDPRVTRVGRFLRRTNLDELPQFLNVLRGEMSIVGPRPHPTPLNIESKARIDKYLLRHRVKPGITGWAQVHGLRGETRDDRQMSSRVEYDLWYIEHWTFWLDLQILLFTAWRMFRGDPQAY